MFYTYILQSETSNRFYIGQTNNVRSRLERHNNGHNLSTRNRGPWKLLFSMEFSTRSQAVALERKLKAYKNPHKVMKWIENQIG